MYKDNLAVIRCHWFVSKNWIIYNITLMKGTLRVIFPALEILWSEYVQCELSRFYVFKNERACDFKGKLFRQIGILYFVSNLFCTYWHAACDKSAISIQALDQIWTQTEIYSLFVSRSVSFCLLPRELRFITECQKSLVLGHLIIWIWIWLRI